MRAWWVLVGLGISAAADAREVDLAASAADARDAARELLGPGAPLVGGVVRHSLTGTHVRFATLAEDGTRLFGGEASVHLRGAAGRWRARLLHTGGRGVWRLVAVRRVGEDDARARALAAAGGGRVRLAEAVALPSGPYVARPAWRVLVELEAPPRLLEVWVDAADGGASVGRDLLCRATATGWVYRPNPVTASGRSDLVDGDDADTALLTSLREQVTLEGLDGSGLLRGEYVDVRRRSGRLSRSDGIYDYTRSQVEFSEVNAYYHIDRAQRQIQALGFSGAKAVLARPVEVVVDAFSDDQSNFDPSLWRINAGTGGVDDAEDADILVHEYGHAVQHDVVPGFGTSVDARAIGEGWSDIQAYALPTLSSKAPVVERVCLAPWDAVGYLPPAPCLRRVDGPKHYPEQLRTRREPHFDGEIWSGVLNDVFRETGLGPLEGYKLVLESMYDYPPDVSFVAAGNALLDADVALHGGAHVAAIRRALLWRGLLSTLSEPASFDPDALVRRPWTEETVHPLPDDSSGTLRFTEPGATVVRPRFKRIDLDPAATCSGGPCDALYVFDGDGNLYAKLTGVHDDVDGPAVPGDTVVLRWVTSPTLPSVGIIMDGAFVVPGPVGPPDAGPPPLPDARVDPPPVDARVPRVDDAEGGCTVGGGGGARAGTLVLVLFLWVASRRRHG